MMKESSFQDSKSYKVKKSLDKMLPIVILFLGLYLYIEFLASPDFLLYSYKIYIQYLLLLYFVVELAVLFSMYESNKRFLKNHWVDIILTVPFVTALKGLSTLKVLKSSKAVKTLKSGKVLRGTKMMQKSGKFVKKTRKQYRKKKPD